MVAAIIRRGTAAITVIPATATIRATTATEATIGHIGGIASTAGIMAAGTGTAGAMDAAGTETVVMGTGIIDSGKAKTRQPFGQPGLRVRELL